MSDGKNKLAGPDLTRGISLSKVADGAMVLGHAHGEAVLLVRRGDELFAIGATCTHYGGPRDMLGLRERFDAVPFFWTEQYDFALSYVGHAEKWDSAKIDGRLGARGCTIT